MMSRMFGAPLGGTTRGGHQEVDSAAVSLITPPNFGGDGGSCVPSIVVVALGEPGIPVTCCAEAEPTHDATAAAEINNLNERLGFIASSPGVHRIGALWRPDSPESAEAAAFLQWPTQTPFPRRRPKRGYGLDPRSAFAATVLAALPITEKLVRF
jgi:hypothetical protein